MKSLEIYFLHGYCIVSQFFFFTCKQIPYRPSCCAAGRAAGRRPRPLWGWSRAPRPWRCWSPAAGCWPPESTPSTGCRCPAWTPWGGGTPRRPRPASPRRSGRCCRCWWRTGWSSDLKNGGRRRGREMGLSVEITWSFWTRAKCFVSFCGRTRTEWAASDELVWAERKRSGIRSVLYILNVC